jgi:hypothetical protein
VGPAGGGSSPCCADWCRCSPGFEPRLTDPRSPGIGDIYLQSAVTKPESVSVALSEVGLQLSRTLRRTLDGLLWTLTNGPFRRTMQIVRGLVRVLVVGFTLVSLLLVGVVGVSATSISGKAGTTKAFNSVVSLVSGHSDQKGDQNSTNDTNSSDKDKEGKDKEVGLCHAKKDHKRATPGHEHHPCPGDRDGDEPESPGG